MQGWSAKVGSEHNWSSFNYNTATQFPIITRGCSSPCQNSLWHWPWCCLISFQLTVRGPANHLKMYLSHHFCACQQLHFPLLLVIVFQVLLQYSNKGDTHEIASYCVRDPERKSLWFSMWPKERFVPNSQTNSLT